MEEDEKEVAGGEIFDMLLVKFNERKSPTCHKISPRLSFFLSLFVMLLPSVIADAPKSPAPPPYNNTPSLRLGR